MTKAEVLQEFKEIVLPGIKETYEKDGRVDMHARCEAWNNYTDMLYQDGEITSHQYNTWTNPF